jgi:hypothetical protein
VTRFVGSIYTASRGNPQVLPVLVMAFREWQDFYNVNVVGEPELLWNSFEFEQPMQDAISFLKEYCSPMSSFMERAIFDGSSDFADVYRDFCEYYSELYPNNHLFTSNNCGE